MAWSSTIEHVLQLNETYGTFVDIPISHRKITSGTFWSVIMVVYDCIICVKRKQNFYNCENCVMRKQNLLFLMSKIHIDASAIYFRLLFTLTFILSTTMTKLFCLIDNIILIGYGRNPPQYTSWNNEDNCNFCNQVAKGFQENLNFSISYMIRMFVTILYHGFYHIFEITINYFSLKFQIHGCKKGNILLRFFGSFGVWRETLEFEGKIWSFSIRSWNEYIETHKIVGKLVSILGNIFFSSLFNKIS